MPGSLEEELEEELDGSVLVLEGSVLLDWLELDEGAELWLVLLELVDEAGREVAMLLTEHDPSPKEIKASNGMNCFFILFPPVATMKNYRKRTSLYESPVINIPE